MMKSRQHAAAPVGPRPARARRAGTLIADLLRGYTLAHELTHVIQQRQGPVGGTDVGDGLKVSDPLGVYERAAEANAARVMRAPLTAPLAPDLGGTASAEHSTVTSRHLQRMSVRGGGVPSRVSERTADKHVVAAADQPEAAKDAYGDMTFVRRKDLLTAAVNANDPELDEAGLPVDPTQSAMQALAALTDDLGIVEVTDAPAQLLLKHEYPASG